jgi:hypothetical protein
MAADNNTTGRNLNDAEIHQFSKGWNVDLDNHIEQPSGYSDSLNGRLYSKNGTLAFTSLKGTSFVYNNENIVQYNGYYAFEDELIVFAKGNIPINELETVPQEILEIVVNNFSVNTPGIIINNLPFLQNFSEQIVTIQVPVVTINENDFIQNLTEVQEENVIDVTFNGLFKTLTYMPNNPVVCQLENEIPINNEDNMNDVIFSFKFNNDENVLIGEVLFSGYLNIPLNAIITTEGVSENIYFKRVYFSDYYNGTRVVNVKDKNLFRRNAFEFDLKTAGTILSPRINSIKKNGQLKAMTVFYAMKLLTENGQESDFSPLSRGVKITKEVNGLEVGGDTSEVTNKSVSVDCYIPNFQNFKEVQLIAIEFEAKDVPTSIKLVGTKPVNGIVNFEHFGSESEYRQNITLADLFANSISWKYNSDFTVENNKLIVSGLRNDPSFLNSKELELDFSLAGFDANGETHNSLLNPEPTRYTFINNDLNESFFYIKKKLYNKIEVFGNFRMELKNLVTGDVFVFLQNEIIYNYIDRTAAIAEFLMITKVSPTFAAKFPNLNITMVGTKILFEPINPLLKTDFKNYTLTFSTSQVIISVENDTDKKTLPWPQTNFEKENALIYGGVSNGWFNGNGVKVTMHTVKEVVLEKNTDWMNGTNLPLQIQNPNGRRCVMKGEVYRLGIQFYKNGNRLFSTILGDVKIPDIGMRRREIDLNGNIIPSYGVYKNWSVLDNQMFAEKIELRFDVRINCELSKEVDAYQIVYVERTEENRTILAQGISAPLERMSQEFGSGDEALGFEEVMVEKWMLPSNGGPVYDYQGLLNYDVNPDMNESDGGGDRNIVTSRRSFYFDSPEFAHNKVSTDFVESSALEYIETITTDHDRHNILGGYNVFTSGFDAGGNRDANDAGNPGTRAYSITGAESTNGPYPFGDPKFSQKIPSNLLSGNEKTRPFFVNVSVFSNMIKRRVYEDFQTNISQEFKYAISNAKEAQEGEVLSSYKMNDNFDYANHALTLGHPGWFYGKSARRHNNREQTTFRCNNIAGGRKTVFIKTANNFFSTANIAQASYIIKSKVNFGQQSYRNADELKGHDAYIVSNLKRNNVNSIYGGRSEFAYSSNEYIALSEVIPVITNRITSQIFYVEGDTYCSIYLKNKSSYKNTAKPELVGFHWLAFGDSNTYNANNRIYQYTKYNAWCYAVVLESTVEPRLTNSEEFYLFSKAIDFDYEELYNSAYIQENTLRKSIPKPYNFKDDPILNNVVAVSRTKLNGESVDAWTQFPPNEFYELDKIAGTVFNIVKEKDGIYAIQENQTSKIQIDERAFVTPDNNGEAIQIKQGGGNSISGHTMVSNYGTSFRRAIIENDFGFIFYDEKKFELVKITEPLFLKSNLSLLIRSLFQNNNVIDVNGYYDEEYKETNIRFRSSNGTNFVVSFNELLKVFNGKYEYDNDIYFEFQQKVFAPYENSKKIGRLNTGNELNFFDVQKNIKIKVISAPIYYETKINKGIAVYLNTNYPLVKAVFETSLNQIRTILGSHHWYKIREGVHTLPAKNANDINDIRGEWCSIEIESESINNKQVKIFSLINFFRKSYK